MTIVARSTQGFLEGPHRLLTPKSLFPNRVLPNPSFLCDDHFPVLTMHHKCEFRAITPKQRRWGPWKTGFYLGTDHITLPSGHQLRRCLIGRPVDGRYSDNGKYLPPSAERFWLIPALGQVWPEKTHSVDVPEPSIPYNEVLLVLNAWRSVLTPMVTEVPMQGTLAPMAVWYRGDADVFSLLFADYEGTNETYQKDLPYCQVRITEGPFTNTTLVTYRAMPCSAESLQVLKGLGCVSFQELIDKRIATKTKFITGVR